MKNTLKAIGSALFIGILALSFGAVKANATFCQILNGCTGTSTAPTYGQLLIGGQNGEYEFVASTTFGGGGSGSSASTTLLTDNNTFGGIDLFTNASSNFNGTWQTFAPAHFQTALTATWPQILTGSTLTFGGLGTSSPAVISGIPYFSSANQFANVATSSGTVSSPLTGNFICIGSGCTLGIQAASASQNGYLASADYSRLHTATTTFSTPLVYTLGTNAVTCPTCITSLAGAASSTLLGDNNTFGGNDVFNNLITGSVSGNAGSATILQTTRTINNVNFNGSGNITLFAASSTALGDNNTFGGNDVFSNTITGSVSGSAATLTTPRTINNVSFNGSANIVINAASSTLLGDNNTFIGGNIFGNSTTTNATTTNLFSTTASSSKLFSATANIGALTINGITGGTQCVQITAGVVSGTGTACGSGSGAVSSVSNSDNTLSISPTTGSVVASINLTTGNVWTASTTFTAGLNARTATTTSATTTNLAISGVTPSSLLAVNANGQVIASSTIGNAQLQNSQVTVNTSGPLGGGGAVSLGGTLSLTCSTCVTSTGVTSIAQTYGTTQNGAIVFSTTSDSFNGLSFGEMITNSGANFTFSNNVTGTLGLAGGGTGATTLTGCLTGNGTSAVTGSGTCNTTNATVSSVGLSSPNSTLTLGGTNPVTSSGTFNADLNLTNGNIWVASTTFTKGLTAVTGTTTSATSTNLAVTGTISLPSSSVTNTELANSSVTINTSGPLAGGATVSLGNSLTLSCPTCLTASPFGYPFTPGTFGTTNTSATSTTINDTQGFVSVASSTLSLLSSVNSTSTNATSTNFFTATASSTNLFSQAANVGALTLNQLTGTQCLHEISGVVSGTGSDCGSGGGAVSSVSNSDLTLSVTPTTGALIASLNLTNQNVWTAASTTFTGGVTIKNATTTNATSTNLFATTASTTNLFGANLTACTGGTNALTWTGGLFGCQSINTGVTTIAQTYGTGQAGAIVLGTTTDSYQGLNFGEIITNSGGTFTLSNNVSGTLGIAGGGTGATTLTGCLTGNGTGAITGSGTCNTTNATVSSVGLSSPNSTLTLGGTNPVTTSGTINADLNLTTGNIWTAASTTFTGGVTIKNGTTTNATSTNFFTTTSSSTNLFTTNATITNLAVTGSATSTFGGGINLTTGCFAISSGCIGAPGTFATGTSLPVQYATVATLPAYTASAGVITEVGTGALSVDGNSPTVGQRILVKNESGACTSSAGTCQNGIYTVTAAGSGIAAFVITRALDYNSSANVYPGIATYVIGGATLSDDWWALTTAAPITVGTTGLTYVESSGGGASVASVSNSDGTLTISPTTGAVIGSLALSHGNVWTATTTFAGGLTATNATSTNATSTVFYAGASTIATTETASKFNATSSAATSTFSGNILVGTASAGLQPVGGVANAPIPTQFQVTNNDPDLITNETLGNLSSSPFALGGLALINSGTPPTGGATATNYAALAFSSPTFAAYPGLLPNSAALNVTDGQIDLAATSANEASSSINFASGPGFTSANYDVSIKDLSHTQFPGNAYQANLGIGSSTPFARLTISASSTSAVPYILVASTTNCIVGAPCANSQTIFTLNNNGNVGIGTSSPSENLTVNGGILGTENKQATSTSMTVNFSNTNQTLIQNGASNLTVTLTGLLAGQAERVVICNPASAAGTVTWATSPANELLWPGGSPPTQTTTANKCDVYTFTVTQATSTTSGGIEALGGYVQNF